jgi:hypothetical protein
MLCIWKTIGKLTPFVMDLLISVYGDTDPANIEVGSNLIQDTSSMDEKKTYFQRRNKVIKILFNSSRFVQWIWAKCFLKNETDKTINSPQFKNLNTFISDLLLFCYDCKIILGAVLELQWDLTYNNKAKYNSSYDSERTIKNVNKVIDGIYIPCLFFKNPQSKEERLLVPGTAKTHNLVLKKMVL